MTPWEREQNLAGVREGLPPMWYAIYSGCMSAGFTDEQAMSIVLATVSVMMTTRQLSILPPGPPNPEGRRPDSE